MAVPPSTQCATHRYLDLTKPQAIVRPIIENHSGHIPLSSASSIAEGTTFPIEIPESAHSSGTLNLFV